MPLLQNHIAVVTGAGSGIGRAIAIGYAREGAQVVLLDINEQGGGRGGAGNSRRRRQGGELRARRHQTATTASRSPNRSPTRSGRSRSWSTMPASTAATAFYGASRGRDQGLGGHHRDQSHRRLQRDACVSRAAARQPRGASSISARSSRSCMCARRVRRPIPPPSTACSASPRRSPPNSARTACASTRSARASSRRR